MNRGGWSIRNFDSPLPPRFVFIALGFKTFFYVSWITVSTIHQLSGYILGKWRFHASIFSSSFSLLYCQIYQKKGEAKITLAAEVHDQIHQKSQGTLGSPAKKGQSFQRNMFGSTSKQHTSIYRRAFSARGSGDFNFQFLFGYGSGSTWSTASCLRVAKNLVTNCCHSGFKNILNINATQVQVN